MKVYPLIYSRTKLCDYVSGFLVRPSDLNYSVATRYVSIALDAIKYSNGLRHAVFGVEDYIIYGGTACVTSALIGRILKDRGVSELDYYYKDYVSDQAGRPITFFIGFAVKRSTIESPAHIPNVDLYETYKIYLSFLEKQWANPTTKTQILSGDEAIELSVIEYSTKFVPKAINIHGIAVLNNYDEYSYQDIINYYYHELATNPDSDNSFISGVLPEMLTNSFAFKNASLYDLTADSYMATRRDVGNITSDLNDASAESDDSPKVYSSSSEYAKGVSQFQRSMSDGPSFVYHSTAEYRQDQGAGDRKKLLPTSKWFILVIAVVLLVGMILLVAHRIAAKKESQHFPKSTFSVQEQQNKRPMPNPET